MATVQDLTDQTETARKSAHQANVDQARLRRLLVELDRQPDGPGRNELARLTSGALSRRMVLGTLQAADLLGELCDLLPSAPARDHHITDEPREDGLDLRRGHWHAQAKTSGLVRLSLVPDVVPDETDSGSTRRQVAQRTLATLEGRGFTVHVRKSAGRRAKDELADWGEVYLSK